MIKITVFTPTYNRAYIIKNVYDSLLNQTYKYFEWLVVDDGSIDETENLINTFILEGKINIRYLKKENGGQHTALNLAIEEAKGDLLMIVDSDDYLTMNALERIVYWENTIVEKHKFAGVSGLKIYPSGEHIGHAWENKKNYIDATNLERTEKHLCGDKAEAYYVNVLKKFAPIPVFEGENDVEKGVLWNRIAYAGFCIRWFNEGIYVCEYLKDGMSLNIKKNHLKNFRGYTLWMKEKIKMQHSIKSKLSDGATFVSMAKEKKLTKTSMAEVLDQSLLFVWTCCAYNFIRKMKKRLLKTNEEKNID